MLGILITGLSLLGALLFTAGYLVGREVVPGAEPVAAPALLKGVQQQQQGAGKSGAIAPAAPGQSAVPGLPAVPSIPGAAPAPGGGVKLPEIPALPVLPVVPPPKPTSNIPDPERAQVADAKDNSAADRSATKRVSSNVGSTVRAATAIGKQEEAEGRTDKYGYVVYVGAFESQSGAETLMDELRSRNLNAHANALETAGGKTMITVWVGVFNDRASARAVLPEIREAGVANPYVSRSAGPRF